MCRWIRIEWIVGIHSMVSPLLRHGYAGQAHHCYISRRPATYKLRPPFQAAEILILIKRIRATNDSRILVFLKLGK